MRHVVLTLMILLLNFYSTIALADTYPWAKNSAHLIGTINFIITQPNDNLPAIAQRSSLGITQLAAANAAINPTINLSPGIKLKLPTQFIPPHGVSEGIIINLPEMRLYLFMSSQQLIKTYPIGIGKIGQTIPVTNTIVTKKIINPIWIPTENIRAFNRKQGIILPNVILPGPENPLGPYAIYLAIPEYRIHSTDAADSIGRRASFGCIRMRKENISDIFNFINPGTAVHIVNFPTKLAWVGNKLYLEAHEALADLPNFSSTYPGMVKLIQDNIKDKPALINWPLVKHLASFKDGIPHEIGIAFN